MGFGRSLGRWWSLAFWWISKRDVVVVWWWVDGTLGAGVCVVGCCIFESVVAFGERGI